MIGATPIYSNEIIPSYTLVRLRLQGRNLSRPKSHHRPFEIDALVCHFLAASEKRMSIYLYVSVATMKPADLEMFLDTSGELGAVVASAGSH